MTLNNLQRQEIHLVLRCCPCKHEEESIQHLFVTCDVASSLWNAVALKLDKHCVDLSETMLLLEFFTKGFSGKGLCMTIARMAFCARIYYLWDYKNDAIFNESKQSKLQILRNVEFMVRTSLKDRGLKEDTRSNRNVA